jgi:hypothetical protein
VRRFQIDVEGSILHNWSGLAVAAEVLKLAMPEADRISGGCCFMVRDRAQVRVFRHLPPSRDDRCVGT